jgi:large subunit ribosomal protein L6
LTFKSANKELVGHVCSQVRALRPPEPYKGTGIKLMSEILIRKAGKTKSA